MTSETQSDFAALTDEVRRAVHAAALSDQKIAMFHFQVLKNSAQLDAADGAAFCQEIGVPATYVTEFRKMLSLARVVRQQGIQLLAAS